MGAGFARGPLAPGTAPAPALLVELRAVTRAYRRGSGDVVALADVSLAIGHGESVAVVGPSGSGKTTLLGIVGCLDRPTAGSYALDGIPVQDLDDAALSRVRNQRIGFVFQSFHLIPQLTVRENVETPLHYGGAEPSEWRGRALRCLEKVALGHRADHRPAELSGGEAQRAAIARALVNEPGLILADEPTGNLDTATGEEVAELLAGLNGEGRTVVLVTHDAALAARARRVIRLRDGRVESDEAR